MKVFRLRGEPINQSCEICRRKKSLGTGILQCDACSKKFEDGVCAECAAKRCPKCKRGSLKDPQSLFPASLFKAIREGDAFAVSQLLGKHQVDLNALTHADHGETALSMAARVKDSDARIAICERLTAMGASVHCRDGRTGNTPLMNAVQHRRLAADVAELLTASVNDQNDSGRTALMYAAEGAGLFGNPKGNIRVARQLLDLGADPSLTDKRGRTALGHAMMSNKKAKNQAMVDLLEEEMIYQAALHHFDSSYDYAFGTHGDLRVTQKSQPQARARRRSSRK